MNMVCLSVGSQLLSLQLPTLPWQSCHLPAPCSHCPSCTHTHHLLVPRTSNLPCCPPGRAVLCSFLPWGPYSGNACWINEERKKNLQSCCPFPLFPVSTASAPPLSKSPLTPSPPPPHSSGMFRLQHLYQLSSHLLTFLLGPGWPL